MWNYDELSEEEKQIIDAYDKIFGTYHEMPCDVAVDLAAMDYDELQEIETGEYCEYSTGQIDAAIWVKSGRFLNDMKNV